MHEYCGSVKMVDRRMNKNVELQLFALFRTIDADNSGHISLEEFKTVCQKLSLDVSTEEINRFLQADVTGDSLLDFTEFCQFYISSLDQVFKAIDTDGSGHIAIDELEDAFRKLGHSVTRREIKQLLSQVDKDQSGSVDFQEFCEYFASLPSPTMKAVIEQWSSGLSIDVGTDLAPPPIPPPSLTIWRALLAGGVAGVVSRTATAPLEKIKLIAQIKGEAKLLDTFKSILAKETWKGLYAGNATNCLRVLPFSALVCLAYFNMGKYLPLDAPSSSWSTPLWRMGAGASAGIFATLLTHPMDVIRAQLTIQPDRYPSIAQAFRVIYTQEGVRGLYRGVWPTLTAIAPFIAIQQSTYDVLKHQATKNGLKTSPLLFLTCGSIAGLTAQTVIYPLDVVRRRLQVNTGSMSMIRNLTVRQLFAGLLPTYLKVMPSAAISLLVRDAILGRLKK
jgi:solute carrier family 25 phosphate transporter 23/24/25/41